MASLILLRDHLTGSVDTVIITDEEQADAFERYDMPEPLLQRLQSQPLFRDVATWGDMDTAHYHALLVLHLSLLADAELEMDVVGSPIVKSLRLIFASLVYEMELRIDGLVSQITINRISETLVQIDLSASIHGMELPKPSGGLKVVVDNS